jgi:hypothetical protein
MFGAAENVWDFLEIFERILDEWAYNWLVRYAEKL